MFPISPILIVIEEEITDGSRWNMTEMFQKILLLRVKSCRAWMRLLNEVS